MINAILPLVILALVAWGVTAAVRRRSDGGDDGHGPAGTLRRLFWYAALAVGVGLTATGVSELIGLAVPVEGDVLVGGRATQIAAAFSYTIVGVPLVVLLGRATRRRLTTDLAERRSVTWSAYVAAMTTIAAITTMTAVAPLIGWAFGEGSRPPVGTAVAWAGVWWIHRRVSRHPALSPLAGPNAAVAFESTATLAAAAGGTGALLASLLGEAYSRGTGEIVVGSVGSAFAGPGAWVLTGGTAWAVTWLADGERRRPRTPGLATYELSVGVLGGLVTVIAAGATVLFTVLEWLIGTPEAVTLTDQLSPTPDTVAAGIVGAAVWWRHRRSAGAPDIESGAERAYRYLAAGIGLGASAIGVGILVSAALGSFTPTLAGEGTVDVVLGGATTLLVGLPLWWTSWSFLGKALAEHPDRERSSTARRVYLTTSLGLGGVTAVGAGVAVLYAAIVGALEGHTAGAIVDGVAIPAGVLVAAGAVAGTHYRIWREERTVGERHALRLVTIVAADTGDLPHRITSELGARVVVLRAVSGPEVAVDSGEVVRRLGELSSTEAVVFVEGDTLRVVPVERG